MSEKKNEKKILNLLKIYKWEVILAVLSIIMLGIALLCEYVFYPKNTEFWFMFFAFLCFVLSFICFIGVTRLFIVRFFKENWGLILFTILMLSSMAFLNSTQISAIVFPIVFELIGKVLFSNNSLKGLEKKIQNFNSENEVKLIVNKNYFEDRQRDVQYIVRLMISFMWILPVLVYDVLVSLASYVMRINEKILEQMRGGDIHVGDLLSEHFGIAVNNITGSNDLNESIFIFANKLIMKYDKVTLCMTFMMIFMVIFFIILFTSKRVKEMSEEYVERKNRPFIKSEVKSKEKWKSFFTDDEIVYIDKAE